MTDQQLADRFAASELPQCRDDLALRQLLAALNRFFPCAIPQICGAQMCAGGYLL